MDIRSDDTTPSKFVAAIFDRLEQAGIANVSLRTTANRAKNASVKEFLGCDSKEGFIAAVRNGQAQMEETPTPLPRFRVLQVMSAAQVRDGQTLVLYGGTTAEQIIAKGTACRLQTCDTAD